MSLTFYPKSHRYKLDGAWVPGVTTLLGKGLPKPAIPYWAAKTIAEFVADNEDDIRSMWAKGRGPMVAYLKEVPWQKRDDAAARGSDIHDLAEQIIHGNEVEVPEAHADMVQGYADWLEAFKVEVLHTEVVVGHRASRYAGKFDAIIRFGAGPLEGETLLVDWKTSKGVYGETALQTAAYARAEFMVIDDEEVPLPHLDGTGVLHITEGESLFYPLATSPEQIDEHFKLFRHIAFVASNTDRIKTFIPSEPMEIAS